MNGSIVHTNGSPLALESALSVKHEGVVSAGGYPRINVEPPVAVIGVVLLTPTQIIEQFEAAVEASVRIPSPVVRLQALVRGSVWALVGILLRLEF